jgi:alkylation response protein AidB-like acyl-CoA dehydrogenase
LKEPVLKSIYFTEDHVLFRQTVRSFMEDEVAPHADAWEAERRIPKEIWARRGEMGFLGLTHPEQYGGAAADAFYAMIFCEEVARSKMGGFTAAVIVQEFIATSGILKNGTEAQKQAYLVPSIEGKKVGAICISEPDAGSDVAAIRTSAVRDGDHYVINGAKTWITNGTYGDFYVVAVKTNKEAGAQGISLIAMDTDLPGITVSKLRKMGLHCSDTAEIAFENVRVPVSNLVGHENLGFYYIMQTFVIERLTLAATCVGACDMMLDETLKYMEERMAFGKPISKFQALRHRLADLFAEVEASRQLVYHTAWLYQNGHEAIKESSMAKMLTAELQKKVADECLQMFGGFGYVEEYVIERAYRDARVSTIVAGTTEIMREIIAKICIDKFKYPRIEDRIAAAEAALKA